MPDTTVLTFCGWQAPVLSQHLPGKEGWVVNFISAPPDSSQNIFRSACFSILLRKQIHVQLQRHLLQNELSRSVSRTVPARRHRHACAPHRCHRACAPRRATAAAALLLTIENRCAGARAYYKSCTGGRIRG